MKNILYILADTGSGSNHQKRVAKAMLEKSQEKKHDKPQAIFILGDNIYDVGVSDIDDPQFHSKFEDIYEGFRCPFYLCLGNHDYGNGHYIDDRWKHQIEYSQYSKKWNMPSRYYHKAFGMIDFFFLDTNFEWMSDRLIEKQYRDIIDMIKKSKGKYKILCGHHTWRSIGGHGNADKKFEDFMQRLLNHSDFDIDAYLCGHDHCKNHHIVTLPKKKKVVHAIVIGTGGQPYHPEEKYLHNLIEDTSLQFHSPNLGYMIWSYNHSKISIDFYDDHNVKEYGFFL